MKEETTYEIHALKKNVALNSRSIGAWVLLADEYLKRRDWSSSLATLESAAGIFPDSPLLYLKAARILRLLHKKTEWLQLLRKAESRSECRVRPVPESASPKKRVLLMAGERSMVFHDCRDGFEALGWETGQELFGDASHQEPEAHEMLVLRIRSFQPRLVISINQAGCDREGFILSSLKDAGIPAFIWYVDDPFALLPQDHPSMVRDAALLGSFDSSYVCLLKERTGVEAIHLPLGTNPNRFRLPRKSAPDPDWTISFAGNLDMERADRRREAMKDNPSALRWVDRAVAILTGSTFSRAGDVLGKSLAGPGWEGLPLPLRDEIFRVAGMEASAKRRLEVIAHLREEGIRVVGGPEWRRYIDSGHWTPPVDYLTGLCGIYHRSRIVLNISRHQLRSGVTQRVFDAPAAGSFLLTDRTAEVERYLLPQEEVVLYENMADLKEKASYYLAHERERKDITARARRRVLHEHTYGHRIRRILSELGLNGSRG